MGINHIEKLLAALEEADILLQRARLMCQQAEKELKVKLNERWEIVEKE